MPRNVRNFWLELGVDGSRSSVATGPRRADGGFDLAILQRDKGGITRTLTVRGVAGPDGQLTLMVFVPREAEGHRATEDVDPGDIVIRTQR